MISQNIFQEKESLTNFCLYIGSEISSIRNKEDLVRFLVTLHGVTKPIVLDAFVRIPPAATGVKNVAGFKISGIIKRSDFGIGAGFANVILGDEVTLNANGEFAKK